MRGGAAACLALAFGLAIAGALASPVRADEAEDNYKLAVGLYKKQRWDLAAENFRKFIQENPRHERAPMARLYAGLALVNLKEFQAGRELLREYAKSAPDSPNLAHALYRIAECSYLLDDLKSAEPELSGFVARFPDDRLLEYALPYLGDVQLRLDRPNDAVKSFKRSLEQFPKGSMAENSRFALARSYEAQKQYPEAIKLYELLAADPTQRRAAEAQLNLAARHFEDGDYPAAAAAYARVVEKFPESPFVPAAHLNLGYALYQQADFKKAVAEFAEAAKDPKNAVDAAYWTGLSLKALGNFAAGAVVLQKAYDENPTHPLAANLLYQSADCAQRKGDFETAKQRFADVAQKFPNSDLADDALHFAGVAALDAGDKAAAESLLNQFAKNHPGSGLRWHQEILRGRLDLLNDDPTRAIPHFQKALDQSESPTTKGWARYYLGYALHQTGKDGEALAATEPLAAQVDTPEKGGQLAGVHLLRATIQLAQAKAAAPEQSGPLFQAAIDSATRYLATKSPGDKGDRGLSLRALAAAQAGQRDIAQKDLTELQKEHPQSPELERTLHELAEAAYAERDWDWAAECFRQLAERGKTSPYHAQALAGLGWTQFRRQRFAEAAESFGQVATEHADDKTAPEAAFMQGKALQAADHTSQAIAAYEAVFRKYPNLKFGYLAGLQRARLLGEGGQTAETDAAYAELLKAYPKPDDLDRVLDEWAMLHYSAQNFAKADEIFRRLIMEAPQSELADNARLSLAESALLSGKVEEAQREFAELEKSPQADPGVQQSALFQLINIDVERKDWKDLRARCEQLISRFPDSKHAWYAEYELGEADLNLLNLPEARERLTKVLSQKKNGDVASTPWFPQTWILLAETLFRLKDYRALDATVADFREWDPKSNLLYVADEILGRGLKAQAMFPEARAVLERVINDPSGRRTETAAKSQLLIAETYLLEKNFKTAEEEYLKVEILYMFPEWQAPALFQAATCQEAMNRPAEAVKSYESLIKQYPTSPYAAQAKEKLLVIRKKAAG